MRLSETPHSAEMGEQVTEFPLLEQLVSYVTTDNPEVLKQTLFEKAERSITIDIALVKQAVAFMEEVHEGQLRKYSHPDPANKKPFINHTIATALMVHELMGDEVTTDALIVALLHDACEDGKITEKGEKRNVKTSDIIERGFSQRMASAIEALSNVRDNEDSTEPGGFGHVKLTPQEYADSIKTGIKKDPQLGLAIIKACDRSTNLLDPFRNVQPPPGEMYGPNAFTSRQKHMSNTRTYLFSMIEGNERVSNYLHDVTDLARLTCTQDFNRASWKTQLKNFQRR